MSLRRPIQKGKESRYGKRYGLEFKLRCVKLRLEEEIPISLLSKEVGCSQDVIRRVDYNVVLREF